MAARTDAPPRVVLLDWDNTLHDSAAVNFEALRRVLAAHGVQVTDHDYRRAYTTDYRELYRRLGLPDDRIPAASARWRRLVADAAPRLLPGAGDALARLADAGRRLGLVTTGPRALVERQLTRLGIEGRFSAAVYGDGGPPRPDPLPLHQALTQLEATPREAALCSDTAADMRMARAIGVRAVGIATFAFGPDALRAAGANETAPSVADWVTAIGL
jgi:HAD superfamily hydrolase (TIGR01509 family)